MTKADSASRTVNRICDILNSFSDDEAMLTLTEISRRIELPKSTTYRFLLALESQGMVYSDANSRGYRLGHQLIHWGMLAQASIDLRKDSLPILHSLTESTGESSILSMRFGNISTWVEIVESRHALRLAMRVGQPLSLYAGASSKVLLAFLPEQEIEHILNGIELKPIKKNTITDLQKLRDELNSIRARGYATSFEETDSGAMGITDRLHPDEIHRRHRDSCPDCTCLGSQGSRSCRTSLTGQLRAVAAVGSTVTRAEPFLLKSPSIVR